MGAQLYKSCIKSDYMNPFAWSSMKIEDFLKLIENYDILDFRNIKCELIKNEAKTLCEYGSIVPKITIDNCVEVFYCHYQQKDKYKSPKKIGGYTYHNKINEYAVNEYFKRLERMTEPPVFLWQLTGNEWYNPHNLDIINELRKLKT